MSKLDKPEIQMLNPKNLTPYANNAKAHPVEQLDKIAGQISKFGFDQPIVVDRQRVIIKGHGRREAALRLGLTLVPVIVSDLDEHEAMAARIADNKVASLTEMDDNLIKFDLGTLARNEFDLEATGFELKEIDDILNSDDIKDEPKAQKAEKEVKDSTQFIVTVHCPDEPTMQQIYEELQSRGLECKLVT